MDATEMYMHHIVVMLHTSVCFEAFKLCKVNIFQLSQSLPPRDLNIETMSDIYGNWIVT